jgi:Na+:H+ antiporter
MGFPFAFLQAEHSSSVGLALSILIIFGTAKLFAEILERVGQPGIVGEILAGIVVGPSVLGWITPNDVTATLAELGVTFLLFRVGLEVKPSELMEVGGTSTMVGIAGVVVPFFAGWGLLALWGKPDLESIFVGAALTATSVGITAQVLRSKGLLSRNASKIILAAAVIDDVLALLVLGVVSSVAQGTVNVLELILTSLFSLGFVGVVVYWGHRTVGKVIPSLEGKLKVGEGQFVLTMILLFGLAALSAQAGVAAIIGAFLAGTALGQTLPARVHEQTHGITELLVPFFLAGIGLHFDLSAFTQPSTLLLAAAVIVTAIVSKGVGCALGASKYGFVVARRVGLGMIPRGEFCMVVAQIGLGLKAIPPDTYGVVVVMAVATTMLTPPLLKFAFRGPVEG